MERILLEETKVPVTFQVEGFELGSLDPGSAEENMKKGSRIELPLWLARALATKGADANSVKVQLPKYFSAEKLIGNLKLDAMSVSLGHSPFLYHVCKEILEISPDESPKLLEDLQNALMERFKKILDQSHHMRDSDVSDFTRKLTYNERQLFFAGYAASTEFDKWKNGKTQTLRTSSVITASASRKRKAAPATPSNSQPSQSSQSSQESSESQSEEPPKSRRRYV